MSERFRIILTQQAFVDLESIADLIREESPQNAVSVADAIVGAIDSLADAPDRFRRSGTSRQRKLPVHSVVVRPFIVYYTVDRSTLSVHILFIRHGARRQPRRFN